MAWVIWLLETALCVAAAYLVAIATYPDRSAADRAVVTLLVAPALILVAMQLVGFFDHLAPWPLGITATLLFSATAAASLRATGTRNALALARRDLLAPWRVVRDTWFERDVTLLALVPAGMALGVVCAMIWYYKSWTWDPVWYHVPITAYVIQDHSLRFIDSYNPYIQGYPRNIELLAAWNCIFPHDNRFDDSSQLPFAFLGMALVAAWSRRVGAPRPAAVGLGAAWFALPPVFLEAHSSHVDVACGALFGCAMYFATERPRARDRWMCLLALGLYVGTKFSGLFHLACMAPWIAVRALYELVRAGRKWWRTAGDIVLSIAAFASVGIYKYVQNYRVKHNPLWPFETTVAPLHLHFAGPESVEELYQAPRGTRPSFFGMPGDFEHLITSWFDAHPSFAPDVRSGGFGPAFRWMLLPCVLAVLLDAMRARRWRMAVPILALFALALSVPAAWWPRYTIAASIAALVAYAWTYTQIPTRWVRALCSVALATLLYQGYEAGYAGFIAYPKYFEWARNTRPEDRPALQLDAFHWTTPWGLQRERELRAGDVVTYDESAHFLAEFFTRDYRTFVRFVSSATTPAQYMARLRSLHARWVGVARGSPAEAAVREAGGVFLFQAPVGGHVALYRMPRGF